jgi:hypothetical protein
MATTLSSATATAAVVPQAKTSGYSWWMAGLNVEWCDVVNREREWYECQLAKYREREEAWMTEPKMTHREIEAAVAREIKAMEESRP